MMKNIPNILTSIRILLVPLFPIVYFSSHKYAHYFALIIFILAGITDFLDGYLARKHQWVSSFGTVFDPLADKLMLLVALTALALDHYIPFWVLVVMGIKESFMIGAGLYLYLRKEQKIIPSNLFGKFATVIFSVAIVWIILTPETAWLQYLIVLAVACKLIAFSSYVTFHVKQKHHDH